MNTREKYSIALLCLGLLLAFIPAGRWQLTEKPSKVLAWSLDESSYLTVDQVARMVVSEDSTLRLIDLRSPGEYRSFCIPGAINVPYEQFLKTEPGNFFGEGNIKNVLYSNGDINSNYAFVIAGGMHFKNVYVMKGGLNEWFDKVMNSRFSGDHITPKENALYETRTRARTLFTELNSLPDSLKQKLIESKRLAAKKLDGGCE
jgi:3-mercaptopyruvate sulfurtransferase SseA